MVADGVPAGEIDAILFDINGTILDVETEDWGRTTLRGVNRFLRYYGVHRRTSELVDIVRGALRAQIEASHERYAEFDAVRLWARVLQILSEAEIEDAAEGVDAGIDDAEEMTHSRRLADPVTVDLPKELSDPGLPLLLAQLQRSLSRRRLRPYDRVAEVLTELRTRYRLGIVSDAQSAYARHELTESGLSGFFEIVFVGNDMHRDIFGPAQMGMKTIFTPTRFGDKEFPGAVPDYVARRFDDVVDGVAHIERLAGLGVRAHAAN
ncbi:MAG: HAD family hydrolase [Chloroflexi bacterium]|nr:HAD family hydrolase [Chloroflexota bacterium]